MAHSSFQLSDVFAGEVGTDVTHYQNLLPNAQKHLIAKMSDLNLKSKLWSIAASQSKPTLGLETDEQIKKYERMWLNEDEQQV